MARQITNSSNLFHNNPQVFPISEKNSYYLLRSTCGPLGQKYKTFIPTRFVRDCGKNKSLHSNHVPMEKHLSMDSLLRRRLRWWWSCMGLASGAVCWWRSRCVVWTSLFGVYHLQYEYQGWNPISVSPSQRAAEMNTKIHLQETKKR